MSETIKAMFFRPLFEWFCRYPLLLVCVGAVLWVLYGGGMDLGLPHLFWDEHAIPQFLAGVGVAGLFGIASFVGYLLDADEDWMQSQGTPRSLHWYYQRTLCVLILIAICSLLKNAVDLPASRRIPLILGIVLTACGFWLITTWLAGRITGLPGLNWIKDRSRLLEKPHATPFHLLAGVFFFLFSTGFALISILFVDSNWMSAAFAVCIGLSLFVQSYGFALYHAEVRYFGLFAAVALALLIISILPARNHRLRDFDYSHRVPLPTTPEEMKQTSQARLLDDADLLRKWTVTHPLRKKLVVIAASGGGIRSAAWTMSVLTKLEERIPDLARHTRVITGSSGGMLGAAYYAADSKRRNSTGQAMDAPYREHLIENISADSLAPAVRYMVLRDMPLVPLAWLPFIDRGYAIEIQWTQNCEYLLDNSLSSLSDDEKTTLFPSLIFSPMLVEDGRRLLISNLDLHFLVENHVRSISGNTTLASLSAIQFYPLFPSMADLKLSTAARMNATFPYISPACELPTTPPRHVVDAGYYDNYGIDIAASWLFYNRELLKQYAPDGVVLIQIRDELADIERTLYTKKGSKKLLLPWFTAPIKALFSAREAGMSYRNDEAVEALTEIFNTEDQPNYFTTAVFQFSKPAALSWRLTSREIDKIRNDLDNPPNAEALEQLIKWW